MPTGIESQREVLIRPQEGGGGAGGAEPLHVSIASEPPHLIPYISPASAPFDVHTISPTKIPSNPLVVSFYFIFIRFAPPPLLFF